MRPEEQDDRYKIFALNHPVSRDAIYEAYIAGAGSGDNESIPNFTKESPLDDADLKETGLKNKQFGEVLRRILQWVWVFGRAETKKGNSPLDSFKLSSFLSRRDLTF